MNKETHQALYGTTVEEVRWRECVSYVNSNMESAVGSLYIKRAFSKDSKSTVRILDSKRAPPMVPEAHCGSAAWQGYQSPSSAPHPVTPSPLYLSTAGSTPILSLKSVTPKGICINARAHKKTEEDPEKQTPPQVLLTLGSSPGPY